MNNVWVQPDIRDNVVDFVNSWNAKTHISKKQILQWIRISVNKFNDWKKRYGKINYHNGLIPRDFWLEGWEKRAITDFFYMHSTEGYRRISYMMLDQNIVAVSPSSVYRVLLEAGLMRKWNRKVSKKGTGFIQPEKPHEHWHIDVTYINICGTFYYLCAILDGFSRFIVEWDLKESMTEQDIEIIIERAKEKFPFAKPRIISDNGPQFIAKDFKEFIRISGMTHVRTSPYYPQSNGKIERWNGTMKMESIRPKTPTSYDDARNILKDFIHTYNNIRYHSAIGYITPKDKLEGRENIIFAEREKKLFDAREQRRLNRVSGEK